MLSQTQLPFQYEIDPTNSKLTALGGLPLFLDLMAGLGVIKGLRQCLVGPGDMQGWSVSDVVLALVMVNLAGGECVDDLDRLNADVGFAKLMEGEWVETGQEWAEVCYVPNWVGHKKHGPAYRFLATREPLRQLELPGVEKEQRELPFPTMEFEQRGEKISYKVFGVVTNRDLSGDKLFGWLRKRCGYSEQIHAVMKDDLAGGRMPSGKFGVNAAWWQVMVLALNLSEVMKRLVLGEGWTTKRLKALRFRLIHIGARVMEKGRRIWIRLSRGEAALELLNRAREKIRMLAEAPG